jgi:uncharacterized protein
MTTARRSILHLSSFILLSLLATAAFALEVPPAPTQWFTDKAGVVSPTEADLLNAKLRQFEQDSGAQFIIYVFPSLEGEAMEDFTIRAVERWKVGQKKYDNGLVLFVFVAEKKIRVEVAYGLEGTVTDAFSSRVIREQLAPAFQQGNYARGLNAAADAIITKIKTGEEPVPPLNPGGQGQGQGSPQQVSGEDIGIVPVIIILFVVFFVVLPMVRRGGCGGCLLPFFFSGGGITFGGGGGGFSSGGGFGGFSGGGGSFGGGGASGGW